MGNFKDLLVRFYQLNPHVQLVVGINLLAIVLGLVTLLILVAINPGALESVITLFTTIVSTLVLILSKGTGTTGGGTNF